MAVKKGIQLPNAILEEIGDKNDEHYRLNRKKGPSRKEKRKLERDQKKRAKRPVKTTEVPVKPVLKSKGIEKPGKVKKSVRIADDAKKTDGGRDLTIVEEFEEQDDDGMDLDELDDDIDLDELEDDEIDDDDFDDEFDEELDDEDEGEEEEDVWAKLKAAKANKQKNAEISAASKSLKGEEMSAQDTMAALKALKEKKSGKPMSAEETMAALKAKKSSKNKEMTAEDTMAALKAKKKSKEMSAEDTMAALKEAKKAKKRTNSEAGLEESRKKSKVKKDSEENYARPISSEEKYMMAQDEMEMAYYKKKLKMKSLKLPKADDGLDELLDGLDMDFEEYANSDEEADHGSEIEGSDGEGEFDDEEGDFSEEEEEDEEEEKPKENPYVPPSASAGKYIPPSKRAAMAALAGEDAQKKEEEIRAKKQIKGLLNRLSEANIGTIVNEIESLYQNYSRALLNSIITEVVIESTALQGTLLEQFMIVHAALVTALYRTMGVEFGAFFIQTLVEKFESHFNAETDKAISKEASNLLSLLSEVYTFQLIGCGLVYDFIRLFLTDINEVKTEFLLKIIRNSGPQLRSDDPAALKEIIFMLQKAVTSADQSTINTRTKFLIESITALKNNKKQKNISEATIATTQRMKKFLGGVTGRANEPLRVSLDDIHNVDTRGKWWLVGAAWRNNSGNGEQQQENVDTEAVHDILDAAEPNWMELAREQRMNTDIRRAIFVAIMSSEDYVDACDRVTKLKLKNKQERDISRVILHCCGNEEVYNPFYALVASKLCAQRHSIKKSFQFALWDFLSGLEGDEDDYSSDDSEDDLMKLKKRSADGANDGAENLRRAMHFSRLYAKIVSEGAMSLDVLKTINFLSAASEIKIFLELFLVTLYELMAKKAEKSKQENAHHRGFGSSLMSDGETRDKTALLEMIVRTKDGSVLKGVQVFQAHNLRDLNKILGPKAKAKQIDRIQWGARTVDEAINELANRLDM
ncbi:suppressor of glycerol defect protein 1 [Trichomonascus vanleenenianus]|uniref:Sgd1p n=1 Tax=Trichomonascus vanleenenianus TaxID=2268995 RepID=UPI003ECAD05A